MHHHRRPWFGKPYTLLVSASLILLTGLLPGSWAQNTPQPDEVQLDATKPFVLHGTYQQPAPTPSPQEEHGIVGLDMLIKPNQYPLIQGVLAGTPASRQGIRPGDRIISINNTDVLGQSAANVDALISDIPGDTVKLSILRGAQMLNIRLVVVSLAQVSHELQNGYALLLNGN